MRIHRIAVGILISTAICAPLLAQDLVAISPNAAKVEYEDARVRVVRLRLVPNQQLQMHDRPARVVIPLTPNNVRTTSADGTTRNVTAPAGVAAWSEPARRSVQNLDVPLENIIVEIKQASGPAKPLKEPPSPRPAGYLDEKYHHWQFENQYVRVYDVRIPPGETTGFHTHAYDTVFLEVSGGTESSQVQGQDWKKPEPSVAGAVSVSLDSEKTRVHRVKNEATTEFHVVAVQILH